MRRRLATVRTSARRRARRLLRAPPRGGEGCVQRPQLRGVYRRRNGPAGRRHLRRHIDPERLRSVLGEQRRSRGQPALPRLAREFHASALGIEREDSVEDAAERTLERSGEELGRKADHQRVGVREQLIDDGALLAISRKGQLIERRVLEAGPSQHPRVQADDELHIGGECADSFGVEAPSWLGGRWERGLVFFGYLLARRRRRLGCSAARSEHHPEDHEVRSHRPSLRCWGLHGEPPLRHR